MKLGFYWSMPSVGRQTYTEGFFMNLKKKPGLSPTNSTRNTSTGRAHLTMKKLNHTQNGLKVYTTTFAKPRKKIRSALRIQAESEVGTPKKEAWV